MKPSFWITFFLPIVVVLGGVIVLRFNENIAIPVIILSFFLSLVCAIVCAVMAALRISPDPLARTGLIIGGTLALWCLYGGITFGGCIALAR